MNLVNPAAAGVGRSRLLGPTSVPPGSDYKVRWTDHGWALGIVTLCLVFALYLETRNTTAFNTLDLVQNLDVAANTTLPLWITVAALCTVAAAVLALRRPDLLKNDLPLVLFLALNFLSVAWASEQARPYALHWLLYLSIAFVLYFAAAHYAQNGRQARTVVLLLLLSLTVFCVLSLLSGRMEPPSNIASQQDGRGPRLTGVAEATALLGITVSILSASALAWMVSPGLARRDRGLAVLALIFGLSVTGLTQTRTALLGIAVGAIVALWMTKHRAIVLASIATAPFVIVWTHIGDQLVFGWQVLLAGGSPSDVPGLLNGLGRVALWRDVISVLVFEWTPLFGDGVGTVIGHLGTLPHNEFLMVWIETGTVGLGLVVWAYARLIRRFLHAFRFATGNEAAINLAAVLSLVVALPSVGFAAVLYNEAGWILMISCGLAAGLSSYRENSVRSGHENGRTQMARA